MVDSFLTKKKRFVATIVAMAIAAGTIGVVAVSGADDGEDANIEIDKNTSISSESVSDSTSSLDSTMELAVTTSITTSATTSIPEQTTTTSQQTTTTKSTTTTKKSTMKSKSSEKEEDDTAVTVSVEESSPDSIMEETSVENKNEVSGPLEYHLTKFMGVSTAPNGFTETYYDLDMSGVVRNMRYRGYSEEDYPYWVDSERGTKMLGDYIMVAADISEVYMYNFGDIVETDLGTGIVCDTGSFRFSFPDRYDIATAWDSGSYPGYNC